MIVKLRYAEEFTLNASSGSLTAQYFRANSVFDPDVTGVGHQPMEYDFWQGVYNHYTVVASSIKLMQVPEATTNIIPSYYGVVLSDDPGVISGYTSVTDIFENPNTTDPRISGSANNTIPQASKWTKKSFKANAFFGTNNVEDGGAYGALVTSTPSKQAYYACYSSAVSGNDPGATPFLAVIDYIVLFDQRVQGVQN